MDSQVVARSCKMNFRRDLRWVAKRTCKFLHKYKQVAKEKKKLQGYGLSPARPKCNHLTQHALTWLGWPKGKKLVSTCMQI